MKVFTRGMLLAALTVLVLPLAVQADDRPLIERKSPDSEPTTDQEFLAKAININIAEIKMAERALKESENKDVRTFAQMMVDDHTKMRNNLMKTAKSKKRSNYSVRPGLQRRMFARRAICATTWFPTCLP